MRIRVGNKVLNERYARVGDPCDLDVEPTDSIGSLKARIQAVFSMSDQQIEERILVNDSRDLIKHLGQTLDDGRDLLLSDASSTLTECCVREGDFLCLGWKYPFSIRVASPSGSRKRDIEVTCSDTIRDIMLKIEKVTGEEVREDNFPEAFLSAPNRTLLSFGLYRRSQSPSPLYTIYRNRDNQEVALAPKTPPLVERVLAGPQLQIAIEFPNMPWRFPLLYEPTDTINTIRECILNKYYVSSELLGQTYIEKGLFVLFCGSKQIDEDNSCLTLRECGIKHMDSIQVFEDASLPMLVSATDQAGDTTWTVDMKCFDTVGKLKTRLRGLTGIPEDDQRLIYKDWRLDDHERQLEYYGIAKPVSYADKSVKTPQNCRFWDRPHQEFLIHLASSDECTRLQIIVEVPNLRHRFPLDLEHNDTFHTVRKRITAMAYQRGELFDQIVIKMGVFEGFFGKEYIKDDFITLDAKGIRHMDSIYIFDDVTFYFDISAPEYSGRYFSVGMKCFQTIGMLKEKIQAVTGIPKEKQHLQYLKWFMDDDERRLVDHDITDKFEYDGLRIERGRQLILAASSKRGLKMALYGCS